MKKIALLVIVILAFTVRVISISTFPTGFTQDEAAIGYDAYSLIKTGKDQWGQTLPLTLRSFGDFKMPLYSYLAIPSIYLFGLNEFSTRLPGVLLGTLAVVTTYLMVLELTGKKKIALLSALLLSLSPWHISLSRGAFEANLTTFFIPLGVWLYYLGLKKPKFLVFSALAFGLNLFSYHSARIFTILLISILTILKLRKVKIFVKKDFKKILPSVLVFGGFIILLIYSVFAGAGRRASDVTIFNPTDKWATVADRRYEAILQGLPAETARIFSNKATYLFHRFTSNYLSYFSPDFLFTEGVTEWSYGMIPGRGILYTLEIIPLFLGIALYLKGKGTKNMKLFLLWLLLAPIPAALSKGSGGSGTRAAVMMPAIQIIVASGVVSGVGFIKNKFKNKTLTKLSYVFVIFLYLISLSFFLEGYRYHANVRGAKSMQYGMKEVIGYVDEVEDKYDEILLSRSLSVPNIWVQFYLKIDPQIVQEASKDWLGYENQGYVSIDQMSEYSLGKFIFGGIEREKLIEKSNLLVVGKPEEFREGQETLKTIYYPDKTPAFYIVESERVRL